MRGASRLASLSFVTTWRNLGASPKKTTTTAITSVSPADPDFFVGSSNRTDPCDHSLRPWNRDG